MSVKKTGRAPAKSKSARPLKGAAKSAGAQRVKSAATRAALIAAARELFTEAGYHATGTNDVVALASVTRGALYHHFTDKDDLFETVFLQVHDELTSAARIAVSQTADDTWTRLKAALAIHLKLRAESREAQRILLIDGPVVFGWERWQQLQSATLEGIVATLRVLMDQGVIAKRPPGSLGQLIVAARNDAALAIAHAADPKTALTEVTEALLALVEGLRIRDRA